MCTNTLTKTLCIVSNLTLLVLLNHAYADNHLSQPATPQLGQTLSVAALSRWEITIFPDGDGLPTGSGDATQGQALFKTHCTACHGHGGIGLTAPALAGGSEPLDSDWPDQTIGLYWPYATTLFDYIARTKPVTHPGSFSADESYALTAYLLHLNDLFDASSPLDASALSAIRMPNRNGFIPIDVP